MDISKIVGAKINPRVLSNAQSHWGGARAIIRRVVLNCLIAAVAFPIVSFAAGYPTKAVQLIVPYSPGGAADIQARILAKIAPQYVGKPVVVSNVVGANGQLASEQVNNSKSDGYKLLVARIGSQSINPAIHAHDDSFPYKWDEFTILGVLSVDPYVCAVPKDSHFNSLDDIVKKLKSDPGSLLYSTSGSASVQNMGVQALLNASNLPSTAAVEIPYKGGGEATTALLGGQVDFACNNLSAFQGAIGERLKAISSSTELPKDTGLAVPTVSQQGFESLKDVAGWSGLYGPPGLPAEVVQKWAATLQKVQQDPEWRKRTESAGQVPQIQIGSDAKEFARNQYETYYSLSKKLGLQITSK